MKEILTKKDKLTIFEDKVLVDKRLPKWRQAENGLKKTEVPNQNSTINAVNVTNNNLSTYLIGTPETVNSYNDIDSNVNSSTKWLPLYEVAEGVSFDDLAVAGIKDLTRMIAENKLKFVIGGYGSFGYTQNNGHITLVGSQDELVGSKSDYGVKKNGFITSLKNNINKFMDVILAKNRENEVVFDALKFFSLVKLTSKSSITSYRDRVNDYLKALHNAVSVGQTALMEDLLRGLITNKYESVLYAEGLYYVITEEQMVSYVKQCEKGLKLDYIKNFNRPLPQDIVNKICKINDLEVFDNYVVLYYDPEGKVYKETAYEEAKRKDPILFGVIAGSNKLYYIADWVDEYCDLTLEKFIDTIGVKKEELHMDYNPNNKNVEHTPKPKRKYKKRKKNKENKENKEKK
jgi:hypothetical protein